MQLVGALLAPPLRELEADSAAADPAGHELYLRIMSAAFQALDQMTQDLTLEDLRKLSGIVAEQRRADGFARRAAAARVSAEKRPKSGGAAGGGAASVPPLAQRPEFVQIVEQIYGTRLDGEPSHGANHKPAGEA
jgi:hypothetical protein